MLPLGAIESQVGPIFHNLLSIFYKTAYYRLTKGSDGREYIVGCIDYKEEGLKSS